MVFTTDRRSTTQMHELCACCVVKWSYVHVYHDSLHAWIDALVYRAHVPDKHFLHVHNDIIVA